MHNFHIKKFANKVRILTTLATMTLACSAVQAAPPPPPVYAPEILVTGMNTSIYDGTIQPLKLDGTYFGQAQLGVNYWEHTFEIRNFGNADLVLTDALSITGPNALDFWIMQYPNNIVPPGQRTQFTITFVPSFVGQAHATVNIANNDKDESMYTFAIRGDGVDQPLVGPDIRADLVQYKNYKCKGIPLLFCKMKGKAEVVNLSTDYDLDCATIRVYVVNGDVLNSDAFLVAEKKVKNLKAYNVQKNKAKVKKVKFNGWVPPGYTHIYAEVVPEDGSEDINYTNNRTEHLYGI